MSQKIITTEQLFGGGGEPNTPKKAVVKAKKRPQPNPKSTHGKATKKPHKYRPGTRALINMRKLQKNTDHVIPKMPFVRVVREIASTFIDDLRFEAIAIEALLEASEDVVYRTFLSGNSVALIAGRETIDAKDIKNAKIISNQLTGTTDCGKKNVEVRARRRSTYRPRRRRPSSKPAAANPDADDAETAAMDTE
jgi:histone H3